MTETIKPAKMCLTVSMDQLNQKRPIPFLELQLMDRAIVDDPEKLDPSNLQLIPYVSLIRQIKTPDARPWDMEILTYVRSTKGSEKRLTDKLSVGFGGHIDRLPTADETLLDLVISEAIREIKEELGYDIPYTVIANAVQMELLVKQSLLYTSETPVDSVHIAIPIVVQLDYDANAPTVFYGADGECKDIEWMKLSTIPEETIERFETWSKVIVSGLAAHLSEFDQQNAAKEGEMESMMDLINRNQAELEAEGLMTAELLTDPTVVSDVPVKSETIVSSISNGMSEDNTTSSSETI